MSTISDKYAALGGAIGPLGMTIGVESAVAGGMAQHYANGSIYWSPATGAHAVTGAIRERWFALRAERGLFGFPTAGPRAETRGRTPFTVSTFTGGRIEVDDTSGEVYTEKATSLAAPNHEVPLVAYLAADDDGSRRTAVTAPQVGQWVDEANRVFAAAGVRFVYDGVLTELRNTSVNGVTGDDYPAWTSVVATLNQLAAARRAIVVVHRFGPGPQSIGGGFSWWTYDFVAMSHFDAVNRNSLSILAHELGHHLGLPHTHGREFPTERAASDYVLSGGADDVLDGDRGIIDDTPADPFVSALHRSGPGALTLGGRAFTCLRRNIMSYWDHGGLAELSPGQIDRVRQIVDQRRRRYLDVRDVRPAGCDTVLQQLQAVEARLAEAIRDRDAETDPIERRPYIALVARLQRDVAARRRAAQAGGCL